MAKITGATKSPILKITYYGNLIAVCVISVWGKGFTSGGFLLTATSYVHMIVIKLTTAPTKGNIFPLKPKYPWELSGYTYGFIV